MGSVQGFPGKEVAVLLVWAQVLVPDVVPVLRSAERLLVLEWGLRVLLLPVLVPDSVQVFALQAAEG